MFMLDFVDTRIIMLQVNISYIKTINAHKMYYKSKLCIVKQEIVYKKMAYTMQKLYLALK